MALPKFLYTGIPRGINQNTALFIMVINIIAPGIGTIISAYLGEEMEHETIYVGIGQMLLSMIIVGYIWAIIWNIRLYKVAGNPQTTEESPLVEETA